MSDTEETPVRPPEEEIKILSEEEKDALPGRKFGWVPDVPDIRDLKYKAKLTLEELPAKVDMRKFCGPVLDQGSLGSCTAQALAQDHLFAQNKEALLTETALDDAAKFLPSRLFIYYNERVEEGTVTSDSGAMIRDGIKVMARQGVCPESMWPYSDKLRVFPSFLDKPSDECYAAAVQMLIDEYRRIISLRDLKDCLADGFPVVFGFSVYESFMSGVVTKTGVVAMPGGGESLLGGHAVLAVGYDDTKGHIICINSWGPAWGDGGFFYLPYSFVTEGLADDFWAITRS